MPLYDALTRCPNLNIIPNSNPDARIHRYHRRLMGEMGESAKYEAAKAWSIYEGSVSKLRQPPKHTLASKYGAGSFPLAFARIENHYFVNKVLPRPLALNLHSGLPVSP